MGTISIKCKPLHQISPRRIGQPSSVPKICSMPNTCDSKSPTVTASWLTVPSPPRKFNGAISDMYIGTSDVFSPENNNRLLALFQ